MKFHCKQGSVEHRIFCRTGVNAQSVNGYMSGTGVKVFVFQFAQFASVYGIGKVCGKTFYIKVVCASANLLVGSKSDFYRSVFDFRMGKQRFSHGHNLGNTRFIVRAEQCGSVGNHQMLTDITV